jgi:hypothetical protein
MWTGKISSWDVTPWETVDNVKSMMNAHEAFHDGRVHVISKATAGGWFHIESLQYQNRTSCLALKLSKYLIVH